MSPIILLEPQLLLLVDGMSCGGEKRPTLEACRFPSDKVFSFPLVTRGGPQLAIASKADTGRLR